NVAFHMTDHQDANFTKVEATYLLQQARSFYHESKGVEPDESWIRNVEQRINYYTKQSDQSTRSLDISLKTNEVLQQAYMGEETPTNWPIEEMPPGEKYHYRVHTKDNANHAEILDYIKNNEELNKQFKYAKICAEDYLNSIHGKNDKHSRSK